ncbi:protein phosphatase 2C 12 [Musa troglodytarum]|uniref:protein-serine/threonine phosphatase n=1 Tax=Musa troglodytarum TaxID=320322 RepID=A0A9E7GJE8_9LILI|nr:protein phosphatase 2C 12 [Musa troglodytarum]
MGSCFSSASLKNQASSERKECEEDIGVCVERGDDGSSPDEKRRIASLYSHRGNKGLNQDAAILCKGYGTEEGLFCGVFDGHGTSGHTVSRVVRDYLPALLLGERNALLLAQEDDEFADGNDTSSTDGEEVLDEWKEACTNAFGTMDEELKVRPNLDCSFSGTTAVSIIKQGEDLIVANLGDSRAVMGTVSEEGHLEAIQLTTDLKPSVPQEAERIRKSNGRVFALEREPHIQRVWLPDEDLPGLAMARALGDFQLKNHGVISVPQVSHRRVTSRDLFIVLATDGVSSLITVFFSPRSLLDGRLRVLQVWDALSNEEVVSIVWSTESNADASKTLVEAARDAWKSKFPSAKVDDCTAACLFFQDKKAGVTTSNSSRQVDERSYLR